MDTRFYRRNWRKQIGQGSDGDGTSAVERGMLVTEFRLEYLKTKNIISVRLWPQRRCERWARGQWSVRRKKILMKLIVKRWAGQSVLKCTSDVKLPDFRTSRLVWEFRIHGVPVMQFAWQLLSTRLKIVVFGILFCSVQRQIFPWEVLVELTWEKRLCE